jgi:microcystin-dependent protein
MDNSCQLAKTKPCFHYWGQLLVAMGVLTLACPTINGTSAGASTNIPDGTSQWADSSPNKAYNGSGQNLGSMNATTLSNTGGSQAHQNMQPYLTLNFCVALQGIFPSRT